MSGYLEKNLTVPRQPVLTRDKFLLSKETGSSQVSACFKRTCSKPFGSGCAPEPAENQSHSWNLK